MNKGKKRKLSEVENETGVGRHWSMGLKSSMTDPDLRVASDSLTVTIKDKYPKAKFHFLVIPKEEITNLKALRECHVSLLEHMQHAGREQVKMLQEKYKSIREFKLGYHAVPSMRSLHLHVISQDFDSPSLKTKKHWNSFTSRFFLESQDVINQLKEKGKVEVNEASYTALLKNSLRCHICKLEQANIPKLKAHIKSCYKP